MANKACSICSAPNNAAETVDALLSKKMPLKEIASLSGFGKSSVHRHSQKCWVKTKAVSHKEMKFDPLRHRVLTDLETGRFFIQHDALEPKTDHTVIPEIELRPGTDWIVRVVYCEPVPERVWKPEARDDVQVEAPAEPPPQQADHGDGA